MDREVYAAESAKAHAVRISCADELHAVSAIVNPMTDSVTRSHCCDR